MSTRRILHFGLNRSGTNYLKEILDQHFDLDFLNVEGERKHPRHKHFRLYNDKSLIGRPNFQNDLLFDSFSAYEAAALQDVRSPGASASRDSTTGPAERTEVTDEGSPGASASQDSTASATEGTELQDAPDVAYVIISKDPYSWHLSYTRWGVKNKWSPSPHPYIYEYNAFYGRWLEFAAETDRIAFVRYIDLLKAPDTVLKQLQEQFNFTNTREIDPDVRIRKVPMSGRFSKKRLKYYLDQAYMDKFSEDVLLKLNSYIDRDVALKLGYAIQEPHS